MAREMNLPEQRGSRQKPDLPLLEAACSGQTAVITQLLQQGADINQVNQDGWGALMAAALGDHPETIRFLVAHGANPNLSALPRGRTALIEAAWQEHPRSVEALLECGADPNLVDSICGPAISDTTCCKCILLLTRAGADVNVPRSRYNNSSLLEFAAEQGQLELIEALLDRGARLSPDTLTAAAAKGQIEAMVLLLDRGIEVDRPDRLGRTPIQAAAGCLEALQLLLNRGAPLMECDGPALRQAVMADNLGALDFLLRRGVGDTAGQEPTLHLAAMMDRTLVISRLLAETEVDIDVRYLGGRTPLHRAAESGSGGAIELLIQAGAQVEARDDTGATPLFGATQYGHAEVVQRLLAHGAELEATDYAGRTPLMVAAISHHADTMVELLLGWGAHVEAVDAEGQNALLLALLEGKCQRKALRELMNAGRGVGGVLARFCATAVRQNPWPERDRLRVEVIRLLLERGEPAGHPALLLYAKIRADSHLNALLTAYGVTPNQVDSVEIPAGVGLDWH